MQSASYSLDCNNTTPPSAAAQAFCSDDSPTGADLIPAISSSIKWYSNVGLTIPVIAGTSLSTQNYYVTETTNNYESTATSVAVTVNTTPTAPTAAAQAFCSADSPSGADLIPAISSSIKWYSNVGLTIPVIAGTSLSTQNYYVTETTNNCESIATTIPVTVMSGNSPDCNNTTPPSAAAQAFCSADSPTGSDLVPAISSSIKWYSDLGLTTPVIAGTALTNQTYYVTETTNNYESTATSVAVTVNTTPTAPTAAAQAFCSADSPSGADLIPAISSSIKWYSNVGLTIPVIAGTSLSTQNYYVTETTNNCESIATTIPVTVMSGNSPDCNNTTPPSAAAQAFCSADSPTGSDLVPAISSSIKWYSDLGLTTPVIAGTALTNQTYYVTETTNNYESTATSVAVTVNTTPTAPTAAAQAFCSADSPSGADLIPAISSSIKWYSNVGLTIPVIAGTSLSTQNYYVTETTNNCESIATAIPVTVMSGNSPDCNNTTPPSAAAQAFCSADSPTGSDLVPAISSSIKWYSDLGLTTPVIAGTALTNQTYYVTETTNNYESTATSVAVTVNTTPTAPTAAAQAFCSADSPSGADLIPAISSSIKWYSNVGLTIPVIAGTSLSTQNYYVTETTNNCESIATTIPVTVMSGNSPDCNNTTPPSAAAQAFCSADSPTGSDLVPAISSSIKWYSDLGLTTPVIAGTALTNQTYYVTETTNNYESTATSVAVTVNTTPTAPTAAAQAFCSADSPSGADLIPAISSSIKWYSNVGLTIPVIAGTSLSTQNYYVTETTNNCESIATAIPVTVMSGNSPDCNNTTPPSAAAQAFCSADSPTGSDLVPAISSSIKWYSDLGLTTPVIAGTALTNQTYYVTETTNNYESTATSVAVTVNTTPTAPTAANITECQQTPIQTMDANDAFASTTGITWYTLASGGSVVPTPTLNTVGNITYYAEYSNGTCSSLTRTAVTLTIDTTPSPDCN